MLIQTWSSMILISEWKQRKTLLHPWIYCVTISKNIILSFMEVPIIPGLASPASTRSSIELILLEGWDLASDLEPNPRVWRGKATTALYYTPIIATCIKHKMHPWIRLSFIHHFQCHNHEVSLVFPVPVLTTCRWSLGPSKGSTEPPILPLQHPTRRNSLLCDGALDTTTHRWPPLALHEPEPRGDSLPTQCSESWSDRGV